MWNSAQRKNYGWFSHGFGWDTDFEVVDFSF